MQIELTRLFTKQQKYVLLLLINFPVSQRAENRITNFLFNWNDEKQNFKMLPDVTLSLTYNLGKRKKQIMT